MRYAWLLLIGTACDPIEPSSSVSAVFQPRAPAAAPVVEAPAPTDTADADAPAPADGAFDFDADAPGAEAPTDEPPDLLAAMGIEAEEPSEAPAPEAISEEPVVEAPVPAADVTVPLWPQGTAEGSWGVRLVSTVSSAQPPRAILGLPDGAEVVVEPGTLLPEAQLVILAIGQDAVQVAEIVPAGDRARVETQVLRALYPSQPARLGAP